MKKIFTTVFVAILALSGFPQQLPFFSQYYVNPLLYNPSQAGNHDGINAFLINRSQWKNVQGAPVTNAITVDGPVSGDKIGLGLTLFSDVTDIFERSGASASYSYAFEISGDHRIRAGVYAGIQDLRIDFSKASIRDANDPVVLRNQQRRTAFDAGFGATYTFNNIEAGLAVPHILGPRVNFGSEEDRASFKFRQHILLTGKYTHVINESKGMSVYPVVLARIVPGAPVQVDFNGVFDWQKYGWAGLSYKSGYALGLNLGVRIKDDLSVGYAYDMIVGDFKSYAGAGHEFLIGYRFGTGSRATAEQPTGPANADLLARIEDNEKILSQQQAEIDSLKKTVAAQAATAAAAAAADSLDQHLQANSDGSVRTGFSTDFVDEDENLMRRGDYIIVGSFKNKDNALKLKETFKSTAGYEGTRLAQNKRDNIFNVFVATPATPEEAAATLAKVREIVPEAWILRLQ